MDNKEKKDLDFNNDLAFDLTVKMISAYAKDCKVDKERGVMDPEIGSYLLVNNLAIALLFKAEGYEQDCINILKSAIDDGLHKIEKSRKAS